MHKIKVFSIEKEIKDEFETISKDYEKMISRYAKFEHIVCFNKKIVQAQKNSITIAKKSYSEVYRDKIKNYSICLDESGKVYDSIGFSNIFEKENEINFFIGGAYGFEDNFLKQCNEVVSLSKLTFSHKIAKIVLLEQIYRALSIVNKHPYHK